MDYSPKLRTRYYNENYIEFGFTCHYSIFDRPKPQCVLCSQILANDSMKPSKLKRHLQAKHPEFVNEPKEFFLNKLCEFEQVKKDHPIDSDSVKDENQDIPSTADTLNSGSIPNSNLGSSADNFGSFEGCDYHTLSLQMQRPESYRIQHNNHLSVVLDSLAKDDLFMDVTLTAQGKVVKAHKSVLAAVSPYFRSVLEENPCQHPIIIMPRDIKFDELNSIIGYVYRGEMTVATEDLPSLLRTAEILNITGLASSDAATDTSISIGKVRGRTSSNRKAKQNKPKAPLKRGRKPKARPPPKVLLTKKTELQDAVNPFDFLKADMMDVNIKEEVLDELENLTKESERNSSCSMTQPFFSEAQRNSSTPEDLPLYICPHCHECQRPTEAMELHLKMKHPTKPSFLCACGRVFTKRILFSQHEVKCQKVP